MTIVVVNQAGGADFTSLQAAINAAPATLTEVYEIQLEPGNYVGDLIIPTRLSESYNNCINITHTPGNRATAFGGGTGAHILGNSGGHANTVNGGFVWYQGVAVTLDTTNGNSDEAFRVVGDNTLFQSCFIDAVNIQNAQDGFYLGGAALQRATISSCVIRGFYRAALHIQRRNRTVVSNFIYELYHNTIVDCGVGPTGSVAGVMLDVTFTNASGLTAADVSGEAISYNNVVANVAGYNSNVLANRPDTEALAWRNFSRTLSGENGGTIIWTGQGNTSHQDNSVEEKFGVTDNYGLTTLVDVEPTSGENIYVTDYLGGDFSIAGENAFTVTQNGVSVPNPTDPRVDLTVDIMGNARPTIGTLGAFQFQTSDLLIVANASNALLSNNIDLVQSFIMAPEEARIGIATEEVDLSQNNLLTAAENLVSVSTDNVGLTQASVLPSDDAAHGLTVDTVTLDQSMQLPANSSTFAVTADNVALTQANIVAAADSLIAVTTDNVDLAQNLALSVLGTTNTLQTATLQLEQGNLLQLANMVIATLVDNVDLSRSSALTMSDTLHGMLTDQITLTQGATVNPAKSFLSLLSAEALIEVANVLNVFSSAHNSTTDNAAIIQNSFLEIADVLNSVQTESVTISTGQILDLQGVTHLTSSDQFALTEAVILIAINNVHAVNVDDFDLGFAIVLPVQNTITSTISNNLELTTSQLLTANNAINTIATDSLELLQNTSLIVSSALHQHLSAQLGLFSGEITTPESRTIKIQRDNRIILILPDAPLH